MFSGGSYREVERWLWNFLTSHAKRVDPRVEVEIDAGGEREGKSYGARLRFGPQLSSPVEFDYREVADHRGSLAWCSALAEGTQGLARKLVGASRTAHAGAR